jgi:hypothetical protein
MPESSFSAMVVETNKKTLSSITLNAALKGVL